MAQIFSSVSPAMHQEFELDYMNPVYARFGLAMQASSCQKDASRWKCLVPGGMPSCAG